MAAIALMLMNMFVSIGILLAADSGGALGAAAPDSPHPLYRHQS
jgi:hypothetical protein